MRHPLLPTLALIAFAFTASACCEDAQKAYKAAESGYKFYDKAKTAKGTDQMREAGCDEAYVITPKMVRKFSKKLGKKIKKKELGVQHHLVLCEAKSKKKAPKCEELAAIYRDAKGEKVPDEYAVVTHKGKDEVICDGLFDKTGKLTGKLPRDEDGKLVMDLLPVAGGLAGVGGSGEEKKERRRRKKKKDEEPAE